MKVLYTLYLYLLEVPKQQTCMKCSYSSSNVLYNHVLLIHVFA